MGPIWLDLVVFRDGIYRWNSSRDPRLDQSELSTGRTREVPPDPREGVDREQGSFLVSLCGFSVDSYTSGFICLSTK